MKQSILFIIIFIVGLFSQTNLQAQSQADSLFIGHHYRVIVESAIYVSDILGNKTSDTKLYEAPLDSHFTCVGATDEDFVIRFWVWKNDDAKNKIFNYADSTKQGHRYFLMDKTDFKTKNQKRYSMKPSIAIGAAAVPFKIRRDPFLFTNDVGVGSVFGPKFRLSPYNNKNFYSIVAGIGLSSIVLDSISTEGTITDDSVSKKVSSLTVSSGVVFDFGGIEIGAFMGWDFIDNNDNINWRYQDKPWLSVGFGYSLFHKAKHDREPPGNN
ncbi:MAG: hypothetical protein AB8B69_09885 [Chitinophagales bacterium]